MEGLTRTEVLKTVCYRFYSNGVAGANGFTDCPTRGSPSSPPSRHGREEGSACARGQIYSGGAFFPNFLDKNQEGLARKFIEPLDSDAGTVGGSPLQQSKPREPRSSTRLKPALSAASSKMEPGDCTI